MDSSFWAPLLPFAAAQLLAVASPGPNFLNIVQTAVSLSRKHALAAALAMAVGAVFWAVTALFGLGSLFARFPWLFRIAQAIGGTFLLWIAIQIWRHSADRPKFAAQGGHERKTGYWAAFRTSLGVQFSNPKPAIFFGSIGTRSWLMCWRRTKHALAISKGRNGWTAARLSFSPCSRSAWLLAVRRATPAFALASRYFKIEATSLRTFFDSLA